MYISLYDLFTGILYLLIGISMIYLIFTLHKVAKLITSINDLLTSNKENIDKLCSDLPQITDNLKDVSEVITETTADVVVAKDNLLGNIEVAKDIINILVSVFSKK